MVILINLFFSFIISFIILLFNIFLFRNFILNSSIYLNTDFQFLYFLFNNHFSFFIFKLFFIIFCFFSNFIIFHFILSKFNLFKKNNNVSPNSSFNLLIGKDSSNKLIYIPEKSLYQNILVTGSIGSGKTASALYPFSKQLIKFNCDNVDSKLGLLILDVKGNFYSKIVEFSLENNRFNDVIIIELNGKYKYNPLHKPNLSASILANRLKQILLLFSPNNTESYWLDIAEHILEAFITICRIYNNGYVTFYELHKLISNKNYFYSKMNLIRNKFINGHLSRVNTYNLSRAIQYLENEFYTLDDRTYGILKSEISRMTNSFVSDLNIKNTFCPDINEINFSGFENVIKYGKIVILNMNISKYKNLSKIIATYLKLDFQTEILNQLSYGFIKRTMAFISDEYQEYITASDADFFSQSRESHCINIVATQSYTSLLNSINNTNSVRVIIQNLINKLWFRCDDVFTIEDIQKQIGKEEKHKISKSYSENGKYSNYNFISKDIISKNTNFSESVNSYTQNDFIYDYNFFTQNLETFSCLAFLSDGFKILKPQKISMFPYFKN